jgi:hypothetical protein
MTLVYLKVLIVLSTSVSNVKGPPLGRASHISVAIAMDV